MIVIQCELQKSGFKEDVQVYLSKNGRLNGLGYSSPQMTIPQPCDPAKVPSTVVFQTRLKPGEEIPTQPLPLQINGPRPMYLKDVRLGLEEEKKAEQANQPFLYKYVSIYCFPYAM
jgi:hypothetical protein